MFITYACCLSVLLAFRTDLAAPQKGADSSVGDGGCGVEVRTTGKSQSHDEYEYGFRVPGLVEVVVCDVRKLQEVGCA